MKRFIAEFEEQSFTQVIFPHANTDWRYYLKDAQDTFVNIVNAAKKYQPVLVVSYCIEAVKKHFEDHTNLYFVEYETDDTWARDCSVLCIEENKQVTLLDFTFTAWGGKFEASKDDKMSQNLAKYYSSEVVTCDFILEGGGVESNGKGLVLTTAECVLNANRNATLTPEQVDTKLKEFFGAKEILTLHYGYLSGDDTDSHIDTLARFISKDSIMYVKCEDKSDEHYEALRLMESELEELAAKHKLKLIALPMADALFYDEERLPATYANFLFVNGAILVPTYGSPQDEKALDIFRSTFPKKEIVGVDCSVLVRQHGSLHCVTMNFACGVNIVC